MTTVDLDSGEWEVTDLGPPERVLTPWEQLEAKLDEVRDASRVVRHAVNSGSVPRSMDDLVRQRHHEHLLTPHIRRRSRK